MYSFGWCQYLLAVKGFNFFFLKKKFFEGGFLLDFVFRELLYHRSCEIMKVF